jgi:hypothetical protein
MSAPLLPVHRGQCASNLPNVALPSRCRPTRKAVCGLPQHCIAAIALCVFAAQLRDYFSTDPAAGQARDRVVACPAVRVPRSDVCRVRSGLPGLMSKKPFFGRAAAETADRAGPVFQTDGRPNNNTSLLLRFGRKR